MSLSTAAKALSGALVAGLLVFDASTVAQSAGGEAVTVAEWIRVAASAAIAGLAVYAVPNRSEPLEEIRQDQAEQPAVLRTE